MSRVFTFDAAGSPTDGTRAGAFTFLAIGEQIVQYTTVAGVEQRRIEVGEPIRAIGAAGGDLVVAVPGRVLQYRGMQGPPTELDVGPKAKVVDGDQVVWLLDGGRARRVRAHQLDPPIEEEAALATIVGDELWWVTSSGKIQSTSLRTFRTSDEGVPDAMVGCGGWLWMAYAASIHRISLTDGSAFEPFHSPIGPCVHMVCVGGVLAAASERELFVWNPATGAPPEVVDIGIEADIIGLVPGPEIVWALTSSPEVAVVRFG